MQIQTFSLTPEARKSLVGKGESGPTAAQTPQTTVRRFFGALSLAQRKSPEAAKGGAWNQQSVDTWFLLLRSPAVFTLNTARETASDGVVMTVDAFKSFKWD